jgi:hypothetical protein
LAPGDKSIFCDKKREPKSEDFNLQLKWLEGGDAN